MYSHRAPAARAEFRRIEMTSLKSLTRVAAASLALAVLIPGGIEAQQAGRAPAKDIVQTAVDAGSFKTLVAAVQAAGLVETLQGEGPFTVFAPTDEAFAKLPKGTVEALLADKAALTAVLMLHVVPGRVMAADIVGANGASPRTAGGESLMIAVREGTVRVNDATVVMADVGASNGVIHVIDRVLLPAAAPAQD
jgi:transforming growth factor-beta-induced protein